MRNSPAFSRINRATTIGREIPLRFTESDGRVVERRIDRLINENGQDIVVDYKSGAPDETRTAGDRDQVSRYCSAISAMTGKPCAGWLWYVDTDSDELIFV